MLQEEEMVILHEIIVIISAIKFEYINPQINDAVSVSFNILYLDQ